VQQLELDPVRVVEEDGVVAGGVVVLLRPALDLEAAFAQPASPLVHDVPRADVEAQVMEADRVAVVRSRVRIRLLLTKAERRDAGPLDREVPDRLAALASDLPEAGPADRAEQLTVERQAALDRADDEIDVAELGLRRGQRLRRRPGLDRDHTEPNDPSAARPAPAKIGSGRSALRAPPR
jgi:hypothetical protein